MKTKRNSLRGRPQIHLRITEVYHWCGRMEPNTSLGFAEPHYTSHPTAYRLGVGERGDNYGRGKWGGRGGGGNRD